MEIVASTLDITPTHPVVAGGNVLGVPLSAVSERLEANLVVLRSTAGSDPVAIISLDLLYPGRILRAALESALPELRADQIFLTATHTHQAPMTDDTKSQIGVPDGRYMDLLVRGLSDELRRMMASDTQFGRVSTATFRARHSINRRLRRRVAIVRRVPERRLGIPAGLTFNTLLMAPNPDGATDELVTVLISRSAVGEAQFVIWNYACHPVSFPDTQQIAADFPHYARDILRESLGAATLPVLFLQGFSGNTRPSASVTKPRSAHSWFRRLLLGPSFTRMSWAAYVSWATDLGGLVARACSTATLLADDTAVSTRRSVSPASAFVTGAAAPEVSFHSVRFGGELALVGASAEVVAEFAPKVRAMAGSRQVMCVGCLDHPFGYAPTRDILREGGYEGGDFCEFFDLGSLAKDIEEQMLRGFRSVL